MTGDDSITTDESRREADSATSVRIYHYWAENGRGEFVDQEIEVDGANRIHISDTGHHYIETENGFGMIMPPGWAFIETHPKEGYSPFGLDVSDDLIAAAASLS